MESFLNNNIYIFTFTIILLFFAFINGTQAKNILILHRAKIATTFAIFQLVIFVISLSRSLSEGLWYHLLLTDLCPLIGFLSIFVFLINKEKYYKLLMPWLIIGASITMLVSSPFIGKNLWMLPSYFEHSFMLMQGFLAYIWINKYQKKEFLLILVVPTFLIIWIMLVGYIPWQVTKNPAWAVFSTALLKPAIIPTLVRYGYNLESYEVISVYAILGELNLPYPIPTIIFYTICLGSAYLIAYSKTSFPKIGAKILAFFNTHEFYEQQNRKQLKMVTLYDKRQYQKQFI